MSDEDVHHDEGFDLAVRMTVAGERCAVAAEKTTRAAEDVPRAVADLGDKLDPRLEAIDRRLALIEGQPTIPKLLADFANHALGQKILTAFGSLVLAAVTALSLWATGLVEIPAFDHIPSQEAHVEVPTRTATD